MQIFKSFGLAILIGFGTAVTVQAEVTHIDNEKTSKLLDQGIPLIDVRMKSEWQQTGIVEGSHLLTFFDEKGNYDLKKWVADLEKIAGKDKPFMLICAVGGRTGNISQFLDKKLGFKQVHNVEKGIVHWIASDKPVATYLEGKDQSNATSTMKNDSETIAKASEKASGEN